MPGLSKLLRQQRAHEGFLENVEAESYCQRAIKTSGCKAYARHGGVVKPFESLKPPRKSEARRETGRRKAERGKSQPKRRKSQLPTIQEYFSDPFLLIDPDDRRIHRLLVEGGFLCPPEQPEQLELGDGNCFKETALARWHRQGRKAGTK